MSESLIRKIYDDGIDFKIEKHHEDEVSGKIRTINMRRIVFFGILTIIIETFLIIFYDLRAIQSLVNVALAKKYFYTHILLLGAAVTISTIAHKYKKTPTWKIYNFLPELTNFLLMIFMIIIAVLDQGNIGNIVSYISMLFVCSASLLVKPPKNYFVYSIPQVIIVSVLLYEFPISENLIASILHSSIVCICMLFVSRYLYLNQYIHLMKNIILEEMNRQTKYLSNFDGLTNLANRRYFEELIKKAIENNVRFKGHSIIGIMDVDYFKKINDTYGHHMGDKVLVEISQIIIKTLGDLNLVARWGGEEFIFFFPEKSVEEGEKLLNDVRENIEKQSFYIRDKKLSVTASFGLTEFLGISEDEYKRAFCLADEALYMAKTSGRNRVVYKGEK